MHRFCRWVIKRGLSRLIAIVLPGLILTAIFPNSRLIHLAVAAYFIALIVLFVKTSRKSRYETKEVNNG